MGCGADEIGRAIERAAAALPCGAATELLRDLAAHPPTMDAAELGAYVPATLALYETLRVVVEPHSLEGDAVVFEGFAVVRPCAPRRRALAVLHECAHRALMRWRHSHGDVHALAALALEALETDD